MEENKLITAGEAAIIAGKKAVTIEGICNTIRMNSQNGMQICRLFDIILPIDVMQYLLTNGFTLSKYIGPIGEDITVISWGR